MDNQNLKGNIIHKIDHNSHRALSVLCWTVAGIGIGIIVGLFATAFGLSMNYVIRTRQSHPWLIYFLPIGAVVITFIYKRIYYTF